MSFAHCIIGTDVGNAHVEQTGSDKFRVFMEDAGLPGSHDRYSVSAHLFMSQPGEFIEFTPDGFDSIQLMPRNATGSFADAALTAGDMEAGEAIYREASSILHTDDEELLRQAIRDAACRVHAQIYGAAEDLAADEPEPEAGIEDGPSMRM